MELRMTAHLTGDKTMIQGFIDGHDIHRYNASIINNCAIDEVTPDQRKDAKAVSFGLIYGKTVYGFALDWFGNESDFWITPPNNKNPFGEMNTKYKNRTQEIVNNFFNGFPTVAKGIESCHKRVMKRGFIRTIIGRKRRLPEVFSTSTSVKNRALRQSFNTYVQGSSADYLKMSMIKIERSMYRFNVGMEEYQVGQLCQVHDELMCCTPPEYAEEILELVKFHMENVVELSCPIEAEAEVAYKYGSAK